MPIPTVKDRLERSLQRGADILAPVLVPHDFHFSIIASGSSSGGPFAQGEFARGAARWNCTFGIRSGWLLFHIDALTLAHEDYMRALLGRSGMSHYPGFSGGPLAAFEALRLDLIEHCTDFVSGTGEQFRQCLQRHKKYESLSGFRRWETGATSTFWSVERRRFTIDFPGWELPHDLPINTPARKTSAPPRTI